MSKVICIMGESGSGKTTSMRNLDPKTTCKKREADARKAGGTIPAKTKAK